MDTIRLIDTLKRRYHLKHNPYNIRIEFSYVESKGVRIDACLDAVDVNTGETTIISNADEVYVNIFKNDYETLRACDWEVFRLIKSLVHHELEEAFEINGQRVFDPHLMAAYKEPMTPEHMEAMKRIEQHMQKVNQTK